MVRPTVMIHDGAIDEFVAAIVLGAADDVELLGVVMVDADCLGVTACDVLDRMQRMVGLETPIGLSTARGVNPFPWAYRSDCERVAQLAAVAGAPAPEWDVPCDGDRLLLDILRRADTPVSVVATGPISPLVDALEREPGLIDRVGDVTWMAGAIHVRGNLDPATLPATVVNPYAEWNVFWDPASSQRALERFGDRLTLVPLDISNRLPVDDAFMTSLLNAGRTQGFARLCFDLYALVDAEPFYRLWDTATVARFLDPGLFGAVATESLRVETRYGSDIGALVADDSGVAVDLVLDFGPGGASAVIADILRRIAAL